MHVNFTITYLQCDRVIAVKVHEVKCIKTLKTK